MKKLSIIILVAFLCITSIGLAFSLHDRWNDKEDPVETEDPLKDTDNATDESDPAGEDESIDYEGLPRTEAGVTLENGTVYSINCSNDLISFVNILHPDHSFKLGDTLTLYAGLMGCDSGYTLTAVFINDTGVYFEAKPFGQSYSVFSYMFDIGSFVPDSAFSISIIFDSNLTDVSQEETIEPNTISMVKLVEEDIAEEADVETTSEDPVIQEELQNEVVAWDPVLPAVNDSSVIEDESGLTTMPDYGCIFGEVIVVQ